MSLSESQALTNVNPALAERIRYMGALIDYWGGKQGYLSGVRSLDKQRQLFNTLTDRPVAAPGCSQHQYGFAVDVFWLPIISFRFNIQMTGRQTNQFMETVGEALGLKTVQNDLGHFQIFPGPQFKAWAVGSGFCDPNDTPVKVVSSFAHPDGAVVTRSDGSRTWVWNTTL